MSTYYVATTGSDTNPGSVSLPYLTIAKAVSVTNPGDIVRVQAGTYNVVATINRSGSAGNYITYVADGTVVLRGFSFGSSVSYIKVIGFEVTHTSALSNDAISFSATNSVNSYIELIDIYIHNIRATHGAITCASGNTPTPRHITIRGCRVFDVGIIPGVLTPGASGATPTVGIATMNNTAFADHYLIEYNEIARVGDYINAFGSNNVIRNNYLYDYDDSYWASSSAFHSDSFQPGSDRLQGMTRDQVYEANFCGDQVETNSHFGIWQDVPATATPTTWHGDCNIIIRGNVGYNFGSGGVGVISTDNVSVYNNTFYKLCQAANGAIVIFYHGGSTSTNESLNNLCINNIVADRGLSTDAFSLPATGNTATFSNNLGYLAGSEASYVSTADPLFVDPTTPTRNFRVQSGSPVIAAATSITTITSASGSGTSFDVGDATRFCDGYGIVDGDVVTINGNTTRITAISGNTITVAASVTWTLGMGVYWGSDSTPDIGALPFSSTKLTAASLSNVGTTYTVAPTGDCRGVWFYVDGIPTTWVSEAPYAATIASGTVTAKAYALYAQAAPVVTATPYVPPTPAILPTVSLLGHVRKSGRVFA